MKIRINSKSLLIMTYVLVIVNIVIGMVFKLMPLDVLRKLFIASKVLVLANLILAYLFNLLHTRIVVRLDSVLLVFFVIFELCISKVRGLLIFPTAYLDILIWPLIYLLFRNYTRKYELPQVLGKITEVAMILVFVLSLPLIMKHRIGLGDVGGVVFYVYYCITFLPLALYMVDSHKVKNRLFLFTISLLLLSTKRSGTIVAVVGYVIYLFSNVSVRKDIRNKIVKYWKYIVVFSFLAVLVIAMDRIFSFSILSRMRNISVDGGSGRNSIWILVFEAFENSDSSAKLFGHGFQAVYYQLKPYGVDRLAHNSFIEFLYDYGYVGLGIFMMFFTTLLCKGRKAFRLKDPHAPEMLYSLMIALVFGMTSYFFEESSIIVPTAIFWGCFAGVASRKNYVRMLKQQKNSN